MKIKEKKIRIYWKVYPLSRDSIERGRWNIIEGENPV